VHSGDLQVMDGDAAGFKVKLIDTIGLEDQESGDSVNYAVSAP
jgi:hypothetical protein